METTDTVYITIFILVKTKYFKVFKTDTGLVETKLEIGFNKFYLLFIYLHLLCRVCLAPRDERLSTWNKKV